MNNLTSDPDQREGPMRRKSLMCLVIGVTMLGSACGGSSSGDTSTKKIAVTFTADSVTPNGDTVDVSVNQPIELDVTADAPGQLHVHSDPAQTFDYKAGDTVITFAIGQPGVVDVESHSLNKIVVQLKVQ
jgi:hypothetical protein